MSDDIDHVTNRTPFARQSIRLAIRSILRTMRGSGPELTYFASRVLDGDGRPFTGLDRTDIARAAEEAILTYEPLIDIEAVDVEMTPAGAVAGLTIRYRTSDSGAADAVRVDFPPAHASEAR